MYFPLCPFSVLLLGPLRRGLFRIGARLKQLLQPVQQRDERYKNGADPISLAKSNNMMRRTRGPMLAIRFQEDDLLIVLNGSPSIPICNMLLTDIKDLQASLVLTGLYPILLIRWRGKNCVDITMELLPWWAVEVATREAPMRMTPLGVCVAYLLLTALTSSAAAPASADDPALQNIEALGNREPDRWQGRHHYLYDDEYQPGSATVGSAPSGARA